MELPVEQQRQMVYDAIVAIAAHCDGAIAEDFQGFNGQDTTFGRNIATMSFDEWTEDIHAEAARLARRYMVQAARYGHDVGELEIVKHSLEHTNHAAREQAREHHAAIARAKKEAERHAREWRVEFARGDNSTLNFVTPYDTRFIEFIKGTGAASWNRAQGAWQVPVDRLNAAVVEVVAQFDMTVAADVAALIERAKDITAPAAPVSKVEVQGNTLVITLKHKLGGPLFAQYRALEGYNWERGTDVSRAHATVANLRWLAANGFTGAAELIAAAEASEAKTAAEVAASHAASRAESSDLDLSAFVPAGLKPFDYQVAGVDYALQKRRTFIADEMGLGKTIQAILALKAADTFPAVIVCPSSLKENWAKEIRTWHPEAFINILSGRRVTESDLVGDYVIVNYDIVDAWADKLIMFAKQALILDESHYAKNPAAKRTKALIKLARSVPAEGLVLALTGTPILNRPVELVTQLEILGRLSDLAPANRRGNDFKNLSGAFKYRYCGPQQVYIGGGRTAYTFMGATNLDELNQKLRATCMIRRERATVLNLSDTVRTQIPLSLNGKLAEYRRAEANVIKYLREEVSSEAAEKAAQAEILVQLNVLRRLAEEAKVEATIEWVQDWLESYPDKKLVVFADHVEVQKALVAAFDCPHILGGESSKAEAQKALFQEGDARVIVCSLHGSASVGHTLTAASDVVFTSLGWTPGGLQQAEDRCNRIGRTADKVVAWQLHAADTVDEYIGEIIATKRTTVSKAIIGGEGGDVDPSVVKGVIDRLRKKGV